MSNAIGLWDDGTTEITTSRLSGYDFLIAKNGPYVHKNVDAAYRAGVPCIFFYENDPTYWGRNQAPLNENNWPDNANGQLQEIIRVVGVRAFHGIMIDCSKTNASYPWITVSGNHLIDRVRKVLGKKTFLYIDGNPIAQAKTAEDKERLYWLVKQNNGMSTPDFLHPNAAKPVTDYNITAPAKWHFWLYKHETDRRLAVMYNGDKTSLWNELNFKPRSAQTPNIPTTPVTPGSSDADVSALSAQITALAVQVSELKTLVNIMLALLERIFK